MKRFLYVLGIFALATTASEAQQHMRISLGQPNQPQVASVRPNPFAMVKSEISPILSSDESVIPAFLVLEKTNLAFSTREHPFPENTGDTDTARVMPSKTDPTDAFYIGDSNIPIHIESGVTGYEDKTGNGFFQIIPAFKYMDPQFSEGTFRIDSLFFSLYPSGGPNNPVSVGMDLFIFQLPTSTDINIGTTSYVGFKADFDDDNRVKRLGGKEPGDPVITLTPDSVNSKVTATGANSFTIRGTLIDLALLNKSVTVDFTKPWGIAFLKNDRTDTSARFGLIGATEWGKRRNQTYGGIVFHHNGNETDTLRTWWSSGLAFSSVSAVDYPTYANEMQTQGVRRNFTISIFGEYDGVISPVSVEPVPGAAEAFTLGQNMPNPVDAATKISFSVTEASHVTLRVVNTLGQTVAELVNATMQPGNYNADFNAANLPQGTYFYTLSSGSKSTMRTMQVVR